MEYSLIATSTFGLESVVAHELRALGYHDLIIENGKVTFGGDERDIARCNIWLRCADRVLIKVAEYKALDFEELFQGTLAVKWEEMIPVDGKMHVTGKSVKSKLSSVPDCQSVAKRAVVEAMKRRHPIERFQETGPVYKIEVALLNDIVTLTIDTSGAGLHKRGYREQTGEAPLRENLAAALVLISRWDPTRILADPFCGSGTIAIEAAMIGKNMAPGLNRNFVSETWHQIPSLIWESVRRDAREAVMEEGFRILASDSDGDVIRTARDNALRAGVADLVAFQTLSAEEFRSRKKYGYIICNPPYGERIGSPEEAANLYGLMGQTFSDLDLWSFFILSAHSEFERYFGRKSDRNRKLYNGNIKCYFYQYLGPRPKREMSA